MVVLTHGREDALDWFAPDDVPELEEAWQRAQRELSRKSSNSELYRVDDAGHFIHDDRLELVVAAVLAVTE